MSRRPNGRLVKIHRTYTVDEAARLLAVHKNTVRGWIKTGLSVIDDQRPALIRGEVLKAFLAERRAAQRTTCPPGTFYCLRCRAPRRPAGDLVDYLPRTLTSGNLRAICGVCGGLMHRACSAAHLDVLGQTLEIAFPEGEPTLGEGAPPRLNSDVEKGAETHADA